MIMNRSIALALGGLLVATALTSLPAQAGSSDSTAALTVQVGDLDLNHSTGIATLYQRLRVAAAARLPALDDTHGSVTGSHALAENCQFVIELGHEAKRQLSASDR
jgi:UrcA family protein